MKIDKKKPLEGATTNSSNNNSQANINKTHTNNHLNIDYQGLRNPIPSPDEIINDYMVSAKFFNKREQHHRNASIWYSNESELMLEKADQEIQKAEICADNYSQYLQLAGIAILKNMGACTHD